MASSQRTDARNAIDLLMDDHKRVNKLFDDFEEADRQDAAAVQELVETACIELQIHSILEEEIFYPAVRRHIEGENRTNDDLLNEAQAEHESLDELIAKLQEIEPDHPMYCAYFAVLSAYVKHHVVREETELFANVSGMGLDLQQLGEDLRLRREELFAEMEAEDGEADTEFTSDDELESSAEDERDEQILIDIPRTRH